MLVGYARVSTPQQSLDAQISILEGAGCLDIYKDKYTGYSSKRPGLDKMIDKLVNDDTVIITSLDRLGRSTADTFKIIGQLEDKDISFKSLREPWADTTSTMGKFLLTVFSGISELERSLTMERTAIGRAAALEKGIQFGRPPKLNHHQHKLVLSMLKDGDSMRTIARHFDVSAATIYRVKEKDMFHV